MRDGDRYAAAAGAQVQHVAACGIHSFKCGLYQRLRVRARNKDIRCIAPER